VLRWASIMWLFAKATLKTTLFDRGFVARTERPYYKRRRKSFDLRSADQRQLASRRHHIRESAQHPAKNAPSDDSNEYVREKPSSCGGSSGAPVCTSTTHPTSSKAMCRVGRSEFELPARILLAICLGLFPRWPSSTPPTPSTRSGPPACAHAVADQASKMAAKHVRLACLPVRRLRLQVARSDLRLSFNRPRVYLHSMPSGTSVA
jgi:hypothetical protein